MSDDTKTRLPAPPTHASCDLRDFPYMPLMVAQFRDSDLAADETPEVCWAAMLIQAASWHQLPAGSIPDDDNWIAKTANYRMRGKTDRAWKRVRQGALHGWIKCNDGRLYHPDVAQKANDAWESKLKQRYRSECARLAKLDPPAPRPEYDEWMQNGCPVGKDGDKLLNPQGFQGIAPKDGQETKILHPKDTQETGIAHPEDTPETFTDPPLDVQEKDKEKEKDKDKYKKTHSPPLKIETARHPEVPPECDETNPDKLCETVSCSPEVRPNLLHGAEKSPPEMPFGDPKPAGVLARLLREQGIQVTPQNPDFRQWVENGLDAEEVTAGVQIARAAKPKPEPIPWGYLSKVLTSQRNMRTGHIPAKPQTAAPNIWDGFI